MWVLITKGFSGSVCGQVLILAPDRKYDLPENVIKALRNEKRLGKNNVIDTCPPWEERLDKKASAQNKKTEKAQSAIELFQKLNARCGELEQAIGAGTIELKKLLPELEDAEDKARKLAKEAGLEWPPKAKTKDAGKSAR
ncbi:MAG: hypothetical protein WC877_05185 [Dehalococcoidales bacterium]|jgi:hypothetical protein|nr:hypothetical protein [Candidatus Neomarinimicrobiota bacterium]MDD5011965.1 hypothetical protein [Phycisphaerae bacterium]